MLVTDGACPLASNRQCFRYRAGSENAFDEPKNQQEIGGFTKQDINRSHVVARTIGLIYNGPNRNCKTATPRVGNEGHCESPHNQTSLSLTPLHSRVDTWSS